MLLKIVSSLRYLAQQGLALRDDGDKENVNFFQPLRMKGDDPTLPEWLKQKNYKYVSPKIQNELLKVMSRHNILQVAGCLQQSPLLTIMLDETINTYNNEQATGVMRCVSESLEVQRGIHWLVRCTIYQCRHIISSYQGYPCSTKPSNFQIMWSIL